MRLKEEGAEVVRAGLKSSAITGKHGLVITPTARIDSLKSTDLHALILPGGWAPDKLRRHASVTMLVRQHADRGPGLQIEIANRLEHHLSVAKRRRARDVRGIAGVVLRCRCLANRRAEHSARHHAIAIGARCEDVHRKNRASRNGHWNRK